MSLMSFFLHALKTRDNYGLGREKKKIIGVKNMKDISPHEPMSSI